MKLLIVYNAKAGTHAGLLDTLHKLVSPGTYDCQLCRLTHGAFRADPRWKAWLDTLPFAVETYHKSDFRRTYPAIRVELPAIFVEDVGRLDVLVSRLDLASIETLDELVRIVNQRMATRRISKRSA